MSRDLRQRTTDSAKVSAKATPHRIDLLDLGAAEQGMDIRPALGEFYQRQQQQLRRQVAHDMTLRIRADSRLRSRQPSLDY